MNLASKSIITLLNLCVFFICKVNHGIWMESVPFAHVAIDHKPLTAAGA